MRGFHSLFLQEVHLQSLHLQEPAQVQEPPAGRKKEVRMVPADLNAERC